MVGKIALQCVQHPGVQIMSYCHVGKFVRPCQSVVTQIPFFLSPYSVKEHSIIFGKNHGFCENSARELVTFENFAI